MHAVRRYRICLACAPKPRLWDNFPMTDAKSASLGLGIILRNRLTVMAFGYTLLRAECEDCNALEATYDANTLPRI